MGWRRGVPDVGISVGTAVDIAKEAADIILLEKRFLVVEDGVIEGRKVFCNKYVRMAPVLMARPHTASRCPPFSGS